MYDFFQVYRPQINSYYLNNKEIKYVSIQKDLDFHFDKKKLY